MVVSGGTGIEAGGLMTDWGVHEIEESSVGNES